MDFGAQVLSHPLLVEAAETLFVPAAVFNNTSGDADDRVRKSFEEPAWNNPVVRIMTADRKDLVDRLATEWTVAAVAGGMTEALRSAERPVPEWLTLLAAERRSHARGVESGIFSMG